MAGTSPATALSGLAVASGEAAAHQVGERGRGQRPKRGLAADRALLLDDRRLRRRRGGLGRVAATEAMLFSSDETTDVGYESGSTVSDDYTAETSKFNGEINWIQLDQGADDADHLITPEERLRVVMARQ